jgi:hypothetical protein
MSTSPPLLVMAGLVPAIHVFLSSSAPKLDVDARHKAGHDGSLKRTVQNI